MSQAYSTLSGWLIPFSRAMKARGIDPEQAFSDCEINTCELKDQETRLAADKLAQLMRYCNKKINNNDFSVEIAKHFYPGMFHALGYAMMSSNTLYDAYERIARYKRIVSNSCLLTVKESDDQLIFDMDIFHYEDSGRPALSDPLIEAFLATMVSFGRELVGLNISPVYVKLTRSPGKLSNQYLEDFFGAPVKFEADFNGFVFERSIADAKLMVGNPLITQVHEQILDDLLSRIDRNDLIYQIKNKIYEQLPMGAPSQQQMATDLGMSLRNLQRKLHEKDTGYKELLEATRRRLALDYLTQQHLSFSEISYLVGFSSVANFHRAFKRWTGKTPGEYRIEMHI